MNMNELISVGFIIGLLVFFYLFYKVTDFFMSRHYKKKKDLDMHTYPEFYRTYKKYSNTITEQWRLENDQEEIQKQIEREQLVMNCFPQGADYDAHSKRVEELRYSYLCKQGTIDLKKMERKELATKLNALPKPSHANQNYK